MGDETGTCETSKDLSLPESSSLSSCSSARLPLLFINVSVLILEKKAGAMILLKKHSLKTGTAHQVMGLLIIYRLRLEIRVIVLF